MHMKFGWALLAMLAIGMMTSCSSSNTVGTPGSGFVWVATAGDQNVTAFSVDLTNGALAQVGNQVGTGKQPSALALTPDNKTMFIANSGDNTIGSYSVNSDGTLTAQSSTTTTGQIPVAMAIDPAGKFLFVANQGTITDNTSGTISVFSISSGSLTQVAGSPFLTESATDATGTGPAAVVVAPSASFIYVANQFTNTVQSYSYDSSGALALVATYTVGTNPAGLAFSRCAGVSQGTANCATADDNNLFVANAGSNDVSIFTA